MPLEHLSNDIYLKWSPIIPREEWGALPPSRQDPPLEGILEHVVFTYTDVEPCHTREECAQRVRDMQRFHMDHGQADIPYSFILGGDGATYVGRGWTTSNPIPDDFEIKPLRTLVIARIGTFQEGYQKDFQGGHNLVNFIMREDLDGYELQPKRVRKDWNTYEKVPELE